MKKNNNSNSHSKPILTVKEAAKLLRVGTQTIKNYIYKGKIKSFKTPGGHHRILHSDLLPYIKENFFTELKNGAQELVRNNHLTKFESLYQAYILTIKAFLNALDVRVAGARNHSERVVDYSLRIANRLNLPDEDKKTLELAALLHDIGKIGISEDILNKPAPLDKEELQAVRRHPELGENMVKGIDFLDGVRPMIRHHHERYDGNGYPDGLKAEGIPIISRIIFVAETYDALTSDHSYRPAVTPKEAIGELNRVAGEQLDKNVVSAFAALQTDKNR